MRRFWGAVLTGLGLVAVLAAGFLWMLVLIGPMALGVSKESGVWTTCGFVWAVVFACISVALVKEYDA